MLPHHPSLHHCQKALKSLTTGMEGNTSTFVAIQKKHENETYTAAMLKIEPEAVVYNDITKYRPQFSGFGLAFRSTMTMMEDEIDEKVYNHRSYACFCYISVSHCYTTCFLVLQVGQFLRALKSINTMAGEKAYVVLLPCTLE